MAALIRTDQFRDLDRLTQQMFDTLARPAVMPIDAYQSGDAFVVHFDLPGVDPDTVALNVERNVLTVRAERPAADAKEADLLLAERPHGVFSRQLLLGDSLNLEKIAAHYDAGVLTLNIPVLEEAKPRRIEISASHPQPPSRADQPSTESSCPASYPSRHPPVSVQLAPHGDRDHRPDRGHCPDVISMWRGSRLSTNGPGCRTHFRSVPRNGLERSFVAPAAIRSCRAGGPSRVRF
ncbi:Hsp20/alpha crystallin family protein [Streptomyces sp. NPDC050564]|uniref:Hsp20/alpha crystallin family protein n=1 Tax=Streptomyces sp. NPDC050564 TaxID=3365631 RepID=UPI0037A53FA9